MKRRTFLGAALTALGGPAAPEALIQLRDTARDVLVLSFVDGEWQELTMADFRSRVVLLNI